MCYSDISKSDTDKVWYINVTTCLSTFKTKVSILIYSVYKHCYSLWHSKGRYVQKFNINARMDGQVEGD